MQNLDLAGLRTEYKRASLDERDELRELETVDRRALLSMADRFGEIRLIDNEQVG